MEGSLCTWLTLSCQQSLGQLTGKRGRQAESDFAVLQIPPPPSSFYLFRQPLYLFSPVLSLCLTAEAPLSLLSFSLSSPPLQPHRIIPPSVILLSFLFRCEVKV